MYRRIIVVLISLLAISCSSKKSNPVSPRNTNNSRTITIQSGNNQTARVGTPVTTPPSVIVEDSSGNPLQGIIVQFSILSGGGTITKALDTTCANGVAAVTAWTVGDSAGANVLIATSTDVPADTAQITATARWPHWTVMVYMAADNNLAAQGLDDLEEIELANKSPEVQIAIQAEFNPYSLQQEGYLPYYNRPDFQTFRYLIDQTSTIDAAPDGAVTPIGNVNMCSGAQLSNFIAWAKAMRPAERYLLVLWNHGSGYEGLLQDLTTSPGSSMSLTAMVDALNAVGGVDIIDFDMCLMASFETLYKTKNVADFAIFSEEVFPGFGNPYQTVIEAINANASSSTQEITEVIADQIHNSYEGERFSTTISAFRLNGFSSVESAMDLFVNYVNGNALSIYPVLEAAASSCQSFGFPTLKDIGSFSDQIQVIASDTVLRNRLLAIKNSVFSLRLRNLINNANSEYWQEPDVSRATGLSFFLPSSNDSLADIGPGSLPEYITQFSGSSWAAFLTDYLQTHATVNYVDLGNNRLEVYLIWDTAAVNLNIDVDLWVLEPNGNVYSPFFGSVSPNGTFTADSYLTEAWLEGYLTNRFVREGTYTIYAWLVSDPSDYQPIYDLRYRLSLDESDYTSLFDGAYPSLSLDNSWLADPTPTEDELNAFAYTDLQPVAEFEVSDVANPTVRFNKDARTVTFAQFTTIKNLVNNAKNKSQHRQKTSSQSLQPNAELILPIRK